MIKISPGFLLQARVLIMLRPDCWSVLGLRFYACTRCETVYAEPVAPTPCPTCGGEKPRDITGRLEGDSYFFDAR
jgi:hypothetical protein